MRAAALALLLAVGAWLLAGEPADARNKLKVKATPATVAPGSSVRVVVTGTSRTRCALTVRADRAGSRPSVRRRVARQSRLAIPASSAAGVRIVTVRCGTQTARTRFTVAAATAAPPAPSPAADEHETYGELPIDINEIAGYTVGDGLGGGEYTTRIPFTNGTRIRVSQGANGGYSHGNAYTRNAVDLPAALGTPVRAGFSGVVAAAVGGCPTTTQWGCNRGFGNFVLLKNVDGTCALHAHLTAINVSPGQPAARYTQLGTVGTSGSSTGAHLHYDRIDCASRASLPWSFEEAGNPREGAWVTSSNEPAPAVAPPTPDPAPAPAPPSAPARRPITVDNRVTNGMSMREDSSPARLTTKAWIRCGTRGCNIGGTERGSGGTYDAAVCQTSGERTTNGNDSSAADDGNPERFESTRYYGVRLHDGTFGFISEVWIRASDRGGLGLPGC
ncbi:murein DD-endopeptidase MepM/ murein hydrolase activator NlpD [Solirubrobacter pauli]|uniref:Murein DD-endopeptidase MepM/ murein hydrolase activator NlpD n=1 Tax=Solirubrobacter pauli TaxID=166793 RepID=A0A660L785_9ACTN|nr:murein DD-endopeptidase MepM/ murein hydrolase activator NlpD [Solirubrobacter pauli]